MPRRNAESAGQQARHARSRLRATLGEIPGSLLDDDGQAPFVFRGPDAPVEQGRAFGQAGTEAQDSLEVGPSLRWRLGFRLSMLLALISVAAGGFFWWQAASGGPEILPLSGVSPDAAASEPRPDASGEENGGGSRAGPAAGKQESPADAGGSSVSVVVHVAGSVLAPGVVELPVGSRVHEAITAAGGAAPGADLNRLNLALALADGQKIHVPQLGEASAGDESTGEPAGNAGSGDVDPAASGGAKVNLNTAGVEELDGLPKVGPVLAQRIVDWRKEHGLFKAVEELDAIDGVGPKMLEALLPLVTV